MAAGTLIRDRVGAGLLSLGFFAALAVAHTWPLATAPATLSRHDSADALLNEWILGWVAHAVATGPLHLFDANIFHPEPRTLAFSEHLLTPSLVAAPLIWAGATPLLAHNLALLAGLALTGWTMALVVERWTGDRWAGLVAGSIAAFNAHTLTRLAHLQAVHVEFLPLALAALDRLLARGRARDVPALAAWTVLQALASGYLLVMTAIALAAGALVRAREWLAAGWRPAARLAAAAILAIAVLIPFLWPYVIVRQEQGLVRSLGEVALYSATPGSYVSTGATLHHGTWGRAFFSADSLFPGVTPLALAVVALALGAWRDRRARMLAAAGLAGVVLSFGPALPGYAWLHGHVAILQGIRGAARFGFLGLFAVAGLAGLGIAGLRRLGWGGATSTAVAAAVLVLVHAEAWRAPVAWTPAHPVSPVYDALDREPPGALVEVPFPAPDRTVANAPAVAASTRHFRKLVNGYSGFVPASYARHAAALAGFPDEASKRLLAGLGVSHVVVHTARDPALAGAASATPWLRFVSEDAGLRLYRIAP
jgi:hypothetical protein